MVISDLSSFTLYDGFMTKPTFTIGALGDSITAAFNAESPGDNALHSWSTGNADVVSGKSHFVRLTGIFPHLDVRAANVAMTGARAADLATQVDRLLPERPDYVTILIGANDLTECLLGAGSARLDGVAIAVKSAVSRLVAANRHIMILLVAVPDQSLVLDHLLPGGAAMAGAWLTTLRTTYKNSWRHLNQALLGVASAFPANVRFCGAVANERFRRDHLSAIDSYHPSAAGQRLLASLTWNSGWFPAGES